MTKAIDVAKYLIQLAVSGEEPDALCHLRLQKLLYYVQGWHLATTGRPMFLEKIEAWVNGPVVADVYPHFKRFGYSSIIPFDEDNVSSRLPDNDRQFIKSVWDEYKVHSAIMLSSMTHSEEPWKDARRDALPKERSSEEITHESMQGFFSAKLQAKLPKGLEVAQLIRGEDDVRQGRYRNHREIRARIANV
jgi:uncharacterized phage-associated protein